MKRRSLIGAVLGLLVTPWLAKANGPVLPNTGPADAKTLPEIFGVVIDNEGKVRMYYRNKAYLESEAAEFDRMSGNRSAMYGIVEAR